MAMVPGGSSETFETPPLGKFLVRIVGVRVGRRDDGTEYWTLTLRVLDGERAGEAYRDTLYFRANTFWHIRDLYSAIGQPFSKDPDQQQECFPTDLQNKECICEWFENPSKSNPKKIYVNARFDPLPIAEIEAPNAEEDTIPF